MVVTAKSDHRCITQNGSYQRSFFYIMRDSDAHIILPRLLKTMIPARLLLMTLRKARENTCEYNSHKLLDVVKVNQLSSQKHAVPHKVLQFWSIFKPWYWSASNASNLFLNFTQITQNTTTGHWSFEETLFLFKKPTSR